VEGGDEVVDGLAGSAEAALLHVLKGLGEALLDERLGGEAGLLSSLSRRRP